MSLASSASNTPAIAAYVCTDQGADVARLVVQQSGGSAEICAAVG